MSDDIQMSADTSTTARDRAAAADIGMEAVGEWLWHLVLWHTRPPSFPQKYQQGQCPGKAVPKSSESF